MADSLMPGGANPSTSTSTPPPKPRPTFNKARNVTYWIRCLRTLLPTEYTGNDLNRTSLAFFCVNGLNILGELGTHTKPEERQNWIEWLYICQHPVAGFRGAPATDLGDKLTPENAIWDPANLPGTFFCLMSLVALGDDLTRVRREETLEWLASLQRPDGSFADMHSAVEEEKSDIAVRDVRFMHMACAIRWILRGEEGSLEREVKDIDVDEAVRYLQSTESYDGGYGGRPGLESHAGHTFCAIAALSLLDRLHAPRTNPNPTYPYGLPNPERTVRWLISRQNSLTPNTDSDDFDPHSHISPEAPSFPPPIDHNGFNGRDNKRTDTCYSFWVCGSLELLKKMHLVDSESNREFLLEVTAHRIGGFGKWQNTPPDVLHSCLGMVTLALFREEGLNRVDPALCSALQCREKLENFEWRKKKGLKYSTSTD